MWEWKAGKDRWSRYSSAAEEAIEELYRRRATGSVSINGTEYTVDTQRLTQTNSATGFHRDLRRKSLVGATAPAAPAAPAGGDDSPGEAAPDDQAMVALCRAQVEAAEKRVAAAKLKETEALRLLEEARQEIKAEEKQLWLAKQLHKNACATAGAPYPEPAAAAAAPAPAPAAAAAARPAGAVAAAAAAPARPPRSDNGSALALRAPPPAGAAPSASPASSVSGSGSSSSSSSSSSSDDEEDAPKPAASRRLLPPPAAAADSPVVSSHRSTYMQLFAQIDRCTCWRRCRLP